VQEWYFLLSHCVRKECISLELYVINYSSRKYVEENTLPNCSFIFLLVVSPKKKLIYF
jgi:hypothetical protein